MRRFHLVMVVALLVGVFAVPTTALASGTQVDVCHANDEGDYHLITVSEVAVDQHFANHGDGVPEGSVPGMEGFKFDAGCVPIECDGPCVPIGSICLANANCCSGECVDLGPVQVCR